MTALAHSEALDVGAEVAAARVELFGGAPSAAAQRLQKVTAREPDLLALYWLAAALGATGDWQGHRAALNDASTRHALGLIQNSKGDLQRLQKEPAYAEMVGDAFYAKGHVAIAAKAFGIANLGRTPSTLSMIKHGLALQHQGRIDEAVSVFQTVCDMTPNAPGARSFLLYSLFFAQDGVRRHAEEAARWSKIYAGVPSRSPDFFTNPPLEGRRLRIGYVAPAVHSTQLRQFLWPVLESHDREHVAVHLYVDETSEEPAETIRVTAGLSDEAVAKMIEDDQIDVLIDLWGHTARGRLGVFARKPAPVTVSWMNYVQTTGLPAMDYLIHPQWIEGPDAQASCVEKIWNIGPVMSLFRPDERPPTSPTPAKAAGYVTFGSYNQPSRLNDGTIAAWAGILKRAPGSKLLLRYRYYADQVLQNITLMRFAAHGVEPERILFRGHITQPDYYASYAEIDLALDPSPCPGGTTSCDAIANGVPVLTLAGDDYYSRIGVCAVGPLGLDQLTTYSWDEYIDRAVELTADVEALDALRRQVRERFDQSEMRNEAGFGRRIEEAFTQMFNLWIADRAA